MSIADIAWLRIIQSGLPSVLADLYGGSGNDPSAARHWDVLVDHDEQSEAQPQLSREEIFRSITEALNLRLETELLLLRQSENSHVLLETFVVSWRNYAKVIVWLGVSSPEFFERSPTGGGKSLEETVLEQYITVVLDEIEQNILDAILATDFEPSEELVKSSALVFYEALRTQRSAYEKRWLTPVFHHFSKLCLTEYPLDDDKHGGLVQLTGEYVRSMIDRLQFGCQSIESFCPNRKVTESAQSILKGLARIHMYKRLKEAFANTDSPISSMFKASSPEAVEEFCAMYIQREDFFFQAIKNPDHEGSYNLQKVDSFITKMCKSLPSFRNGGLQLFRQQRWSASELRRAVRLNLEQLLFSKFRDMLENDESELGSIFKRNDDDEIHAMYCVCLHVFSIDLFHFLLGIEVDARVKHIFDIMEKANERGDWFGGGYVRRIDIEIAKVIALICRRGNYFPSCPVCKSNASYTVPQAFHNQSPSVRNEPKEKDGLSFHVARLVTEHDEFLERVNVEVVPKLVPKMLENKSSDLLLGLKDDVWGHVAPIYVQTTGYQYLEKFFDFILACEVSRKVEFLWDEARKKSLFWRDPLPTVQAVIANGTAFLHKRCDDVLCSRLVESISATSALKFHIGTEIREKVQTLLLNDLERLLRLLNDKKSNISISFGDKKASEIDQLYTVCYQLDCHFSEGWQFMRTLIDYETEEDAQRLRVLMDKTTGKWFNFDNLTKIDSYLTRTLEVIKMRCVGHQDVMKKFKKSTEDPVMCKIHSARKEVNDYLRNAFQFGNKMDTARIYDTCNALTTLRSLFCRLVVRQDIRGNGDNICSRFLMAARLHTTQSGQSGDKEWSKESSLREFIGCSSTQDFVNQVFFLYSRCTGLVIYPENDEVAHGIIKKEFLRLLSRTGGEQLPTLPEILIYYIDAVMRKEVQFQSRQDLHSRLTLVTKLVSHPGHKRKCMLLFDKLLAERLLQNTDFSTPRVSEIDHEKALIWYLAAECGEEMMGKMQGMVSDSEEALTTEHNFRADTRTETDDGPLFIESGVRTLSGNLWPRSSEELRLPAPLVDVQSQFETLYKDANPRRRVQYVHSLGQVTFETALFTAEIGLTITLIGSVFQTSVLLLFNSKDKIKFVEILDELHVHRSFADTESIGTRALIYAAIRSLLSSEFPLLMKEPESEHIDYQDVLSVNEGFTTSARILQLHAPPRCFYEEGLKLPPVQSENQQEIITKVDSDSNAGCVKAAVVRLMKRKKRETYSNLHEAVVKYGESSLPRFEADRRLFRDMVSWLIENDYLKLDEQDTDTLIYIP